MGKITTGVVGKVADYLTGHKTRKDTLIHRDGSPVTSRNSAAQPGAVAGDR